MKEKHNLEGRETTLDDPIFMEKWHFILVKPHKASGENPPVRYGLLGIAMC